MDPSENDPFDKDSGGEFDDEPIDGSNGDSMRNMDNGDFAKGLGGLTGMFGNMFGDMFKMFANQGPVHWDTARQIAFTTATSGLSEANIDPLVRMEYADIGRIVVPHLYEVSGFGDIAEMSSWTLTTVTPGVWANRTLDDYRPLFTDLATALHSGDPSHDPSTSESADPFGSFFANITGMIAPMTMGMTIGSMVGLLARRSLGQYDLPLPRPTSRDILVVPSTVDAFAQEWDLDRQQVRMWTAIREMVIHHLFELEPIRTSVLDLVRRFVGAFRPDPDAISDRLTSIQMDDPAEIMQSLQKVLGDPELLLGAVRSPEQDRLQPELDTLLGLVLGWSDHITDLVSARILGGATHIAEAARRRRIEGGDETIFVEKLLGLHLNRRQVERGRAFVAGVVERAGVDGLKPLSEDRAALPTPSELEAPGLWLARLEVTGDV